MRKRRWNTAALATAGLLAAGTLAWSLYSSAEWLGTSGPRSVSRADLPPPAAAANVVTGLPSPDLLRPLSPEEAAKENAERPFVNRPDSPASKFVISAASADGERALTCLTQAVYYEAAGEGVEGGRAVAQIVLNRMRHPGYPATVCGVIYQGAERATGCQFTFTCDGSLLRTPAAALWARSRKIAQDALAGKVFAPVGHATHYHADYVMPYWADSLDKSVQIGRHIFYRLKGAYGDGRSFSQRYAGNEPSLPQTQDAVVIPPAAVTEDLASALINDRVTSGVKDVEKAAASPSVALAADANAGTLLLGAPAAPAPSKKAKSTADCAAGADRKRVTALGPNDLRFDARGGGC